MANPEHLAKLKESIEAKSFEEWNQRREANLGFHLDLEGADLHGACLNGANLLGATLMHADLRDASLRGADLVFANLSGADLRGADLRGADLQVANLSRAQLRASKFQKAWVSGTVFGNCDLSEVQGLDRVVHHDSSTVGIDTIYLSKGKIPEIFLRGAGVPENFIEYMHSLVGQAFEFYSCFISYSTKDESFAKRLYADLQAKGVRCWFAPHDIKSGKHIHEQIDQAIRLHEKLLLILSPDSINSEWVKREIKKARNREKKENRRVLFPIRLTSFEALTEWELLDPDTGEDVAQEIRKYYIPDFTKWKRNHNLYQNEFDKLLKSLKPEGEADTTAVG